jgi:hypothetical protein
MTIKTTCRLLVRPFFRRGVQVVAIVAMLANLSAVGGTSHAAPQANASAASTSHVYLLRGVLNIFSLGLDTMAEKLRAQGIPVTVANFVSWSSLADEAAAAYKAGKLKTIVLVGHSSGATALPDMIAKLDGLGVPVKLAIGLDSVFRTKLSGKAERYINFYISNGAGEPVKRDNAFRGKLENVDVQQIPGIGHMSIDKNEVMQAKVISAIKQVVYARPKAVATPAAASAPATATAASAR